MTRSKKEGGLGFRDLESFNNALLGKIVARIISKPNALWVRVLKGLYFPNSNFMQAIKGGKTSWGCAILLIGREVIRKTGVSSLGDGKSIRAF